MGSMQGVKANPSPAAGRVQRPSVNLRLPGPCSESLASTGALVHGWCNLAAALRQICGWRGAWFVAVVIGCSVI